MQHKDIDNLSPEEIIKMFDDIVSFEDMHIASCFCSNGKRGYANSYSQIWYQSYCTYWCRTQGGRIYCFSTDCCGYGRDCTQYF